MKNNNFGKKCYAYVRVSDSEQLKGYSTENQVLTVTRIAQTQGIILDFIYEDGGKSAFKENIKRPGFDALIEEVKAGLVSVIIIWKLDRLVRNYIKNESLFVLFHKHGVKIISCTEGILDFSTADGRATIRKKGVDNQCESERTSERTQASLLTAAELGNYPKSRVPLGYKRVHSDYAAAPLIPDEVTGPQVIYIFELIKRNKWGISKLLRHLNSIEHMNRHWSESYTYYLIEDVIYIGTYINNRTKPTLTIKDHTPPLIPTDLFKEVQLLIHSRNYEKKYKYNLKKYMYCKDCGSSLASVSAHNGHTNATYLYYYCKSCRKRINQTRMNDILSPIFDDYILEMHKTEMLDKTSERINRIYVIIKNLDINFIDGIIDDTYYQREKNELLNHLYEEKYKIDQYRKANKLSWNLMSYSSQRTWLKANIIKIIYDFDNENCIIDFVEKK